MIIIVVHDTRIAYIFVITHTIFIPTYIRPLFQPILLLSIPFPINISLILFSGQILYLLTHSIQLLVYVLFDQLLGFVYCVKGGSFLVGVGMID